MPFAITIKRYVITFIMSLACLLPFSVTAQQPAPIKAVATFSILGDLVKNVGGDRIDLTVLVGPGADSHMYSPSATDARALKQATIIFENGLAFEGWMERLVKSSGTKAKVVIASKGISPLETDEHDHDEKPGNHNHGHGSGHGHDHGVDPHAWQNVANAKTYVANIRDGLIALDPTGKAIYEENAKAYLVKLDALDGKIRSTLTAIPQENRKIITSHDAFGYFAKAYGVDFIGVQGVSPDAEPSAKDIASIIRQIRADKIPAIFVETIADPRLTNQIASETGVKVGERIFSDSLSDTSGPAASYIGMMEHNLKAFSSALRP